MSKKKNINDIFNNVDDSIVQRIADITPASDEEVRKKVYNNSMKKSGRQSEDYEDQVSGVEIKRRQPVMRYVSIAAALALIAGSGVIGYNAMNNSRVIDESTSAETDIIDETDEAPAESADIPEESTDNAETDNAPAADYEIADFDMNTQLGIYGKMINSVDYFNKASGRVVSSDTSGNTLYSVVDFEVDMTNSRCYEDTTRYVVEDTAPVIDGGDIIGEIHPDYGKLQIYCDGENVYDFWSDTKVYHRSNADLGCINHRTGPQIDPQSVQDWFTDLRANYDKYADCNTISNWIFNDDEEYHKIFRNASSNLRTAFYVIEPQFDAVPYLADFDSWTIDGSTEYAGRDCVALSGYYNENYIMPSHSNWVNEDEGTVPGCKYEMKVDKATGCLLNFKSYDANGDVLIWFRVENISFDDDAADVRTIDFSSYKTSEEVYQEYLDSLEYDEETGFTVNENGQTYGCAPDRIDRAHYDQLPELIAMGGDKYHPGYVYKDEMFEVFGDDPDSAFIEWNQFYTEGDICKSLTVYDVNGKDVIDTIYFYRQP